MLLLIAIGTTKANTTLLGLMAFVKDDGILCAVIMFGLLLWQVKLNKKFSLYGPSMLGPYLFSSFGTVFLASLFTKYWLSLAPAAEHLFSVPQAMDTIRWYLIGMDFWYLFTDRLYGGIVIIPVILILIKFSVGWKKTAGIMANFLIAYLVCFLGFVLIRNNLVNYLAGASYRFIFQLLPLAMILLFTCVDDP